MMELCFPRLTDVLSTEIPMQLLQGILLFYKTASIFVKTASAVAACWPIKQRNIFVF